MLLALSFAGSVEGSDTLISGLMDRGDSSKELMTTEGCLLMVTFFSGVLGRMGLALRSGRDHLRFSGGDVFSSSSGQVSRAPFIVVLASSSFSNSSSKTSPLKMASTASVEITGVFLRFEVTCLRCSLRVGLCRLTTSVVGESRLREEADLVA